MKPRFAVIDLNGQPCARFETRAYASQLATTFNAETDLVTQDKQDLEFCTRHGVPFQPRRYFVMDSQVHPDLQD